jgi:cyclin-dependent kinase 8/11
MFQPVALPPLSRSSSLTSSLAAPPSSLSHSSSWEPTPTRLCFAVKHIFPQREGKNNAIVTGLQTLREVKWLRELDSHPNVTRLVDLFIMPPPANRMSLVYEFCDHDLRKLILVHRKANVPMPHRMVKSMLMQLLQGVQYLHENWIVHRDLKPPNILVTTQGCVKVADFGFARSLRDPPRSLYALEPEVVTLWYRSPELLLGARHYNFAVDIWSVGCILGEMLNSHELFPGRPDAQAKKRSERFEASQLEKIFRMLGFDERRCGKLRHLEKWERFKMEVVTKGGFPTGSTLKQVVATPRDNKHTNSGGRELMDMLTGMLALDPERRITAENALSRETAYWGQSPRPSRDVFYNTQWQYAKVRLKKMTEEEIERLNGTRESAEPEFLNPDKTGSTKRRSRTAESADGPAAAVPGKKQRTGYHLNDKKRATPD